MRFLRKAVFHEQRIFQVAAAVVGSAVVGGVASNMAAGKASSAQGNAANDANAVSQDQYLTTRADALRQYNQVRADNMPFLRSGTDSANKLAFLLGTSAPGIGSNPYTLDDFLAYNQRVSPGGYGSEGQENDANLQYKQYLSGVLGTNASVAQQFGFVPRTDVPGYVDDSGDYGSLLRGFTADDLKNDVPYQVGYDYAQQQGANSINRLAAAGGSLNSGAVQKALQDRGVQIANQYAGDAQNRFTANQTGVFNKLAGVSGAGQQAVNNIGSAGQSSLGVTSSAGANNASTIGNNLVGLGNARGAAAINTGNSINNGVSSIANYYQNQNLLDSLRNDGINYGTGYSGSTNGGTFGGAGSGGTY